MNTNYNNIKSFLIILIIFSGFMIFVNPVLASDINVYPGDDIVSKIGSAISGDNVYIHAGTYYITSRILVRQSNIKIIGEDPINTIIDGNGIVSSDRCIDATSRDNITIENLTLKNSYRLIEFRNNSTVNNCILYGKNTGGHSTLVGKDNCKVMNTIVTGGKWDGIRIENNGYVFNCLSFNNGDNGIQVGANSYVLSCTSANNGIRSDAGDSAGIVARLTGGNTPLLDNLTVRDCIVINNLGNTGGANIIGGIAANSGTITYTNIYNCRGSPIGFTIGLGVLYEDPRLIDGVSSFYLNPFSPCVDRGSDTSKNIGLYEGFTTRTDQYWDVNTVDMGYHYTSGKGPLVENKNKPMDQILRILRIIEDCEKNPDAEGCKSSK